MIKNKFSKLSIKKQLTLWYSLIIFFVAVTLFSSFYLLTKQYLIYETDRSLAVHASQIAYSVALNTNDTHDTQTKDILNLSKTEIPGMFIEVVDTQGFDTNGKASNFKELSAQALKDNTHLYSQNKINGFTMRVVVYPITTPGIALGSVVMGHPIDVYEKTLAQLKIIGVVVMLYLIAPSILIGYFLAKSAVDPITKLSKDINKITSENLSRRISLPVGSEEVDLLINNFDSLLDRLGKAFSLERQFLGEMAHEIKTPLSVIKSNSEITLAKLRTADEYQKSINQTLCQIDKLSGTMVGLMDFAWSQSTDFSKAFMEINLSQLMLEINNVALYMAAPKNILVESNIEGNIFVLGKEEKLYQAIYNIIDNAVKFTPEKGKITLELYKKNSGAFISVADTGVGIEAEQQRNIFNRFYRTEQTKNIAGHGLGLAVADSIIKAHNGLIEVNSKKGSGSTFIITLTLSR